MKDDPAWPWLEGPHARDSGPGRMRVNLPVGAAHVATKPTDVWTVLGSCVSVVLHVPARQISAICHAQLPKRAHPDFACREDCPSTCHRAERDASQMKFVTCNVEYMVESLAALGVTPREMTAAVIGGAKVLQVLGQASTIGEQNVMMARHVLSAYGIECQTEDVGGSRGRTLWYASDTGRIDVRYHGR